MYNEYFGLQEAPFSIAPNPQYLYMSARHREALAHLLYGIRSDGGFILLTGEVGTGKTTVCRCLLQQIPEGVDTAYVLNPKQTAGELLATVCDELHIDYPESVTIKSLVDRLNDFLLLSHRGNRRTVLIIDEAQNLSIDVLEQLRLLTNLETDQRKLLQIILLGQPELLELLAKPELRQLSQRVTARFHLDALSQNEVGEYIQHRLSIAGARGMLFPPSAIRRVFQISGGVPRLVNLVCDRALLGTYVQNKLQVDVPTVNTAAREILGTRPRLKWMPVAATAIAVVVLAVAGVLLNDNVREATRSVASVDTVTIENPGVTGDNATNPVAKITPAADRTALIEDMLANANEVTATNQPESGLNGAPPGGTPPGGTPPGGTPPGGTPPGGASSPDEAELITPETLAETRAVTESGSDESFNLSVIMDPSRSPYTPVNQTSGFTVKKEAFRHLLKFWGQEIVLAPDQDPCNLVTGTGLRCLAQLGRLVDVAELDRPAVIALRTESQIFWFVVTRITDSFVEVDGGVQRYQIDRQEFIDIWSGFYTLFWRSPASYKQVVRLGDKGPVVNQLAAQLAIIDQQPFPSTTAAMVYNESLEQRIKLFQKRKGLIPDGSVGPQTWIHLNSQASTDVPLLQHNPGDS